MSAVDEYRDARNSKRWKPYWLARADAAIAELEAENARLKCCGNCMSMEEENMLLGLHICGHLHPLTGGLIRVKASDHCNRVPSRWTACAEISS